MNTIITLASDFLTTYYNWVFIGLIILNLFIVSIGLKYYFKYLSLTGKIKRLYKLNAIHHAVYHNASIIKFDGLLHLFNEITFLKEIALKYQNRKRKFSIQTAAIELDEIITEQNRTIEREVSFGERLKDFSKVLQGNQKTLEEISNDVVEFLFHQLSIKAGAIYFDEKISKEGNEKLVLLASIGLNKKLSTERSREEGLGGEVLKSNKIKVFKNIDTSYVITSSLGETKQPILLIIPLSMNSKTYGYMELAVFEFMEEQKRFYTSIAESITATLLMKKNEEITNDLLEVTKEQNKNILDSIEYAKNVQYSFLPSLDQLQEKFNDVFIIFRPKDVVSGDCYFYYEKKEIKIIAVIDCTGHGVPGALMSITAMSFIHEIVNKLEKLSPALILDELNTLLWERFSHNEKKINDGMDLGILAFSSNETDVDIAYAGAKHALLYTENGEIKRLKSDKLRMGGREPNENKKYSNSSFSLRKGEKIYLTTDGYIDQANAERKKIGTNKLLEILQDIHLKSLSDQEKYLSHYLDDHQKDIPQRDDITFIGLEL